MISIIVKGVDKTRQISDWKISENSQKELILTCLFPSGKSYPSPLSECKINPTTVLQRQLLSRDGGISFTPIIRAEIYGGKYAVIQYTGSSKAYLMKAADITLTPETEIKNEAIFRYFIETAEARVLQADPDSSSIEENVQRQLKKALPHRGTALHAYCTAYTQAIKLEGNFIYPFGINESQLRAVENAFSAQISLIEGPPGTGKTQTILNIIANIILRGKTVAILSNNNTAVENVYEKLGKVKLDYLIAKLGSSENRNKFFNNLPTRPSEAPDHAPALDQIQVILDKLKQLLRAKNELARLQAEIDEFSIERNYLLQWQTENMLEQPIPLDKYKLSAQKTSELRAYISHLAGNRIKLKDRFELLFQFKILRVQPFDDWEKRKSLFYALQLHYYDQALKERRSKLADHQRTLELGNYDKLLNNLVSGSMLYLKQNLHNHAPKPESFNSENYIVRIDKFLKHFPIIGSSTHSIINSLKGGTILDYVIIDEASQQDILPGILPLACAKNLVIVGDRKQLPHIPVKLGIPPPAEFYDCEKYSILDSCIGIFGDSIPKTLLKEHYRCHPRIIQFCNQQFYENQLIPMRPDAGEKPFELIVTAKGNHSRNKANLRELDSLREVLKWDGENSRGFIAPYNAQIALSQKKLPTDFVKLTTHKFQGRECDEIVFSTVLDKKCNSPKNLDFVDNPNLVNVAVSRAKDKFTLVTGDNVFSANNGHIAALIRYLEYYAEEKQIHLAPVISAFDLLYKEYDQSLEKLNTRLRSNDSKFKSEQIVAQILRDALAKDTLKAMTFHSQIDLIQVASVSNPALTVREQEFMHNRASCDFVVYFKVGKTPLGVIEVDGKSHGEVQQVERDGLKESILKKCNLPLLRLQTIESKIEEKVANFLAQWAARPVPL